MATGNGLSDVSTSCPTVAERQPYDRALQHVTVGDQHDRPDVLFVIADALRLFRVMCCDVGT